MLFLNTKNEPNSLGVSNQSTTSNKPAKRGSVYGKATISLNDEGIVCKVTPSKRHVVQPNPAVKFGETVVAEEKIVVHKVMADPVIADHAKNSHVQLGGATPEHFKPSINCENSKNANNKKDHIDFVTPVEPQVARKVVKSETQKIFLETEQNSVTKSVEPVKRRNISGIPKKTDKLKSVIEMDKSTMVDDIRKKKAITAKSSTDSISFGDAHTPAVVEQEKKKNKGEYLSPAPITVNHKSQTYKSAIFNSAQYENKENTKTAKSFVSSPGKSNKAKNLIFNHETSNSAEVRSAKKKCGNPIRNGSVTMVGKQCLNYAQLESIPTPTRSAKKMAAQSSNTSIFKFDVCMSPAKQTETPTAKKHFAPVVDHLNQPAAGMTPKAVETMPRSRGPVGGRTSVILG